MSRIILMVDDVKHLLVKDEDGNECKGCSLTELCNSMVSDDGTCSTFDNDDCSHFVLLKDE